MNQSEDHAVKPQASLLAQHPLTQSLGQALLACTRADPCGIPHCSRCRAPVQDRARQTAAQFAPTPSLRACSANVAAIPLADTDLLQVTLRRERDRLRKALARTSGGQLHGAWELVYKAKAGLHPQEYPVLGEADHYVLLHWHALASQDIKQDLQAIYDCGPQGRFSGHRIDTRALRAQTSTEAQNWLAYCWKITTKDKSGLKPDMAGYESLLPQYVHAVECIRGTGTRGLGLSLGWDSPRSLERASVTHDGKNGFQEKLCSHEKSQSRFSMASFNDVNVCLPNCDSETNSISGINSSTCENSKEALVRRALKWVAQRSVANREQVEAQGGNPEDTLSGIPPGDDHPEEGFATRAIRVDVDQARVIERHNDDKPEHQSREREGLDIPNDELGLFLHERNPPHVLISVLKNNQP